MLMETGVRHESVDDRTRRMCACVRRWHVTSTARRRVQGENDEFFATEMLRRHACGVRMRLG